MEGSVDKKQNRYLGKVVRRYWTMDDRWGLVMCSINGDTNWDLKQTVEEEVEGGTCQFQSREGDGQIIEILRHRSNSLSPVESTNQNQTKKDEKIY